MFSESNAFEKLWVVVAYWQTYEHCLFGTMYVVGAANGAHSYVHTHIITHTHTHMYIHLPTLYISDNAQSSCYNVRSDFMT